MVDYIASNSSGGGGDRRALLLMRGIPFSGFIVVVLKSVLTSAIAQIDTEFFLETIPQIRTFFY